MDWNMSDSGEMINLKEMDRKLSVMEAITEGLLKMVWKMEEAFLTGKMGRDMKVNLRVDTCKEEGN